MKKSDIKNFIKGAIDPRKLCRVNFKYDTNYRYCFPVIVSDKLFMGANEYDFLLDGFTISRFKDVVNVKIEENKYLEITKAEGIVDGINIPDINLSDWYNVFVSLQKNE